MTTKITLYHEYQNINILFIIHKIMNYKITTCTHELKYLHKS